MKLRVWRDLKAWWIRWKTIRRFRRIEARMLLGLCTICGKNRAYSNRTYKQTVSYEVLCLPCAFKMRIK